MYPYLNTDDICCMLSMHCGWTMTRILFEFWPENPNNISRYLYYGNGAFDVLALPRPPPHAPKIAAQPLLRALGEQGEAKRQDRPMWDSNPQP
jgi:hypothetical protein